MGGYVIGHGRLSLCDPGVTACAPAPFSSVARGVWGVHGRIALRAGRTVSSQTRTACSTSDATFCRYGFWWSRNRLTFNSPVGAAGFEPTTSTV